jgi:flagellin-specific chaperone FliS
MEEFDFGFTTLATNDVVTPESHEELTDQLQQLYNAIIPLLMNLNANPEKEYIVWPNRSEKIKAFKEKIDKIVGNTIVTKKI